MLLQSLPCSSAFWPLTKASKCAFKQPFGSVMRVHPVHFWVRCNAVSQFSKPNEAPTTPTDGPTPFFTPFPMIVSCHNWLHGTELCTPVQATAAIAAHPSIRSHRYWTTSSTLQNGCLTRPQTPSTIKSSWHAQSCTQRRAFQRSTCWPAILQSLFDCTVLLHQWAQF